MKNILVVLMVIFLVGCASEEQITNKIYKESIENAIHIFEIRIILTDGSFYKFFSIMKPNGFFQQTSDTSFAFIIYFQDVRGQDVYLPPEAVSIFDVKDYYINDDAEKYFEKRKELREYYKQKIRQ